MDDANPPTSASGWRIPKACQECRKRKIRCSGLNPCKTCQQRDTPCIYRDYTRHRRKKHEFETRHDEREVRLSSDSNEQQQSAALMQNYPNSVSATHMASPSCQVQLYYGPTSHFSLMQHVYRDLVSNPGAPPRPAGGIEEAGAGLDLFSFRRIFFGIPDSHEMGKSNGAGDMSLMFLPHDLAKILLSGFLSTLYTLMPFQSPERLEACLEDLYTQSPSTHPDTLTQATMLLILGIASIGTEHNAWADILFDRAKALVVPFDDVVNIQTVQISLLMANFQNESGRPNSTFLHLGTASRKALAAGLHKDVPGNEVQTSEIIEERRITFWCLYLYETWFCFHAGRPTSLSLKDVAIEYPRDPFIRLLGNLCKSISRSAEEIYGHRHESLLHMWKVSRSIAGDLRILEEQLKGALGLTLDSNVQNGVLGVQQMIFNTLYYHTLLLTFRPFLIFRGHWRREIKSQGNNASRTLKRPTEMPPWLNEACDYSLTAARKTIHYLSNTFRFNDIVKQMPYNGYFLSSSTFTLIYDFMHDPGSAHAHLRWVHTALQSLSSMRQEEPTTSTMKAIQTTLRSIDPSYEWSPYPQNLANFKIPDRTDSGMQPFTSDGLSFPTNYRPGSRANNRTSQWSHSQPEGPETGRSGGSTDDLPDFTQSEMGWDFDFSTMDLEAFFSVHPTSDTMFNFGNLNG